MSNNSTSGTLPSAWAVAVNSFLDYLVAAGAPATTRGTRRAHLHRVGRGLGGTPYTVTASDLVSFCARQSWAPETRRGVRNSLIAFYRWASSSGAITNNPAEALPAVPPTPPRPRPAALSDYHRAIKSARTIEHRAMLRLAAEAGLRRAEVAAVHRRDIVADSDGWNLWVHGKGGRDRLIPLSSGLAAELHSIPGRGFLFPGAVDGHLSPRWVGKVVGNLLPSGVTMHQLRHMFATNAYSVDRDTFVVQALLGHASPATTRRYVAVPPTNLRATVERVGRAA